MARHDHEAILKAFADKIEAAAGDNLHALLLFGSAAHHDPHARHHGDLNVFLILRDAAAAALRPLAPAIAEWAALGEPAPRIVSEQGWRQSTDVFPIELEEMRQTHRILRGADPFKDIETTTADLRAELEREARGKLIQLRAEYAAAAVDGKRLGKLLVQSVKTFFVLFRATLRIHGRVPPKDHAALARATAEVAGFDASAFEWPLARLADGKHGGLASFDPVGAAYVDAIARFVDYVDEN